MTRAMRIAGFLLALLCGVQGYAKDDIVGLWAAESRTKGGLGGQWAFAADGGVTYTFGALVDFRYEVSGTEMRISLAAPAEGAADAGTQAQRFLLEGDTLTLNPDKADLKQAMRRSGGPRTADPVVGEWTYMHYTGVPAFMRYSSRGRVQLAVPMKTLRGRYRQEGRSLRLEIAGQQPARVTASVDGDVLGMVDEKGKSTRYTRFRY